MKKCCSMPDIGWIGHIHEGAVGDHVCRLDVQQAPESTDTLSHKAARNHPTLGKHVLDHPAVEMALACSPTVRPNSPPQLSNMSGRLFPTRLRDQPLQARPSKKSHGAPNHRKTRRKETPRRKARCPSRTVSRTGSLPRKAAPKNPR